VTFNKLGGRYGRKAEDYDLHGKRGQEGKEGRSADLSEMSFTRANSRAMSIPAISRIDIFLSCKNIRNEFSTISMKTI
jgi:hypothetical protein